jgi:hypothetical protein
MKTTMSYEAFVPSQTSLIGKTVKDIESEFDIKITIPMICFTKTVDERFKAFDTFRAEGDYKEIRKFRDKYELF